MHKKLTTLLFALTAPIWIFCADCFTDFSTDWANAVEYYENALDDDMCQQVTGCWRQTAVDYEATKRALIIIFEECIDGN